MTGKIRTIDRAYNTVVIEVPLEKGMFTVGGSLSPDAVLTKAKQKVTLEEFAVGDRVVVLWRHKDSGHIINAIKGR